MTNPHSSQPGSVLYEGSVKNLLTAETPEQLWFEYTDFYSVFDWGRMPDPIEGKGQALATMGQFFFEQLSDQKAWGKLLEDSQIAKWFPIDHHFIRQEDNRILVKKVDIPQLDPTQVGGNLVYQYQPTQAQQSLIPLEVIFRFGVPAGSSLLKRKDWYAMDIYEGAEFTEPLIEFSTKLEAKDRILNYQEACWTLGGNVETLRALHGKTRAVALFLQALFQRCGLKLWDGKLEWGLLNGNISLLDSIGPDELRVSQEGQVFSKQFLRDFYLGSAWEQAVKEGESLAKQRGTDNWVQIVTDELGETPPPLSAPYLEAAKALYEDFCHIVVNQASSQRYITALKQLPKK